MVLESLLSPKSAEQRPFVLLGLGFLYCSIGVLLSLWVFRTESSLIMVFLSAMAAIPLMYHMIRREEKRDLEGLPETKLLKEHAKALEAFVFLFIGLTLGYAFWYLLLSGDTITVLFEAQSTTIRSINAHVTEETAVQLKNFSSIFLNNVRVLIFCILFSFIYGSGAIFILSWNASVIGTAMGNLIRGGLSGAADLLGLERIGHYFAVVGLGLLRYSIHGIPEILSYFIAGLAGGIISFAAINHDFGSRKFEHILLDSADLLLLSLVVLFLAGLLEVWVTPWVFDLLGGSML